MVKYGGPKNLQKFPSKGDNEDKNPYFYSDSTVKGVSFNPLLKLPKRVKKFFYVKWFLRFVASD